MAQMLGKDIQTKWTDFENGTTLYEGPESQVPTPIKPIVIHNDRALNRKRVIWLRDSFGNSLSPFMSYTFSDIVQVHWAFGLQPGKLAELVDRWKPDYVFMTVVERAARSPAFAAMPPFRGKADSLTFKQDILTLRQGAHDLKPGKMPNEMQITGKDPNLVYSIPEGIEPDGNGYMKLAINCNDSTATIPLQLFWATRSKPAFEQASSTSFTYDSRYPVLPLWALGLTGVASELTRIRVDIDGGKVCNLFQIADPIFGTLP